MDAHSRRHWGGIFEAPKSYRWENSSRIVLEWILIFKENLWYLVFFPKSEVFTYPNLFTHYFICLSKLHGIGFFANPRQPNEEVWQLGVFLVEFIKQENAVVWRQRNSPHGSADHIRQPHLLPVRFDHLGRPRSVSVWLDLGWGDEKSWGYLVLAKWGWLWWG